MRQTTSGKYLEARTSILPSQELQTNQGHHGHLSARMLPETLLQKRLTVFCINQISTRLTFSFWTLGTMFSFGSVLKVTSQSKKRSNNSPKITWQLHLRNERAPQYLLFIKPKNQLLLQDSSLGGMTNSGTFQ